MSSLHTGIAVLEGKWWRGWNSSVRSTFENLAEMTCENSHAYHYEMANSLVAVDEAIPRIAKDRKCKYLYLAAHGSEASLHLFNGEEVTFKHLRELIAGLPSGSKFVGLYLAACSSVSEKAAANFLDGDLNLTWMAGYSKKADWLPSSALDMLFFKELIFAADHGDGASIRGVAQRLKFLMPGLIEELGFSIVIKYRGCIIDLIKPNI